MARNVTATGPRRRNMSGVSISADVDHPAPFTPFPPTPPSGPPTPRSTLGSPLSTNACRRSGVGDLAAGPRRRNSLSEVEVLPWLCCMTPALSMFGIYLAVLVSSLFFSNLFYWLTAALTGVTMLWIGNLAISSMLGAYNLRSGTQTDWHALLEELQNEDPTANDVLHIVLLPNFRENERMLKDTLENLARSPLARSRTRVVLAMEAREGPAGREKAERLIQQTSHLFADVFATFHPENLPGEVAGKSSNTQWAYREALRQYGPILLGCDMSRVFVTVGDADTLWHPQYLSAVTYQGLTMAADQRVWRIWQPPILLMRNYFSVPAVTRASAAATLIFELSGLANQHFFPAFAYSSYTLTLALASHPEVDGWDVDVIAEDHHMFCKCYFASLWELAHTATSSKKRGDNGETAQVVPRVEVQPVYLPATSFLVESPDGYWASCVARFEQARRHSQGVVELGYVLLQYVRLSRHTGFFDLPMRTHSAILSIALKMHTLHITSTAQCFSLILATLTALIPTVVRWLWAGGLAALLQEGPGVGLLAAKLADGWGAMGLAQQALAASVSNISGVCLLYAFTCYLVIGDLMQGNYYKHLGTTLPPPRVMATVAEGDERTPRSSSEDGSKEESTTQEETADASPSSPIKAREMPSFVKGPMTVWQRAALFVGLFSDTAGIGYVTITFYAMIPVLLAGWSLLRRGTDFEYIVAVKPE